MKIIIFIFLILLTGCQLYKMPYKNTIRTETKSWLPLLIDTEKKRFAYIEATNLYLGFQCDIENMKSNIDKVCCKQNLLWGFEKFSLSIHRLELLDSLLTSQVFLTSGDTLKVFECYEDEGTFDILVWGDNETHFTHFTNDTTTIVYKKEITLEEKRINLAREYEYNYNPQDTLPPVKNFPHWINMNRRRPCEPSGYSHVNFYYYSIFVKDKIFKRYSCTEAILFEN